MGVEDEFYRLLERRRKELGISQAEVTRRAFGAVEDSSLLQNIRRSTKRGPSLKNLAAACDALGLKLEIVPRDANGSPAPAAPAGFGEEQAVFVMDRPKGARRARLSDLAPDGAFYFRAEFDICDRLWRGWHGLVEPAAELRLGDFAYGQDAAGEIAVFRWLAESDRVPDGMLVDPYVFGTGHESWSRADFVRLHPVTWTGRTPPRLAVAPAAEAAQDRAALDIARIVAELQDVQGRLERHGAAVAGRDG